MMYYYHYQLSFFNSLITIDKQSIQYRTTNDGHKQQYFTGDAMYSIPSDQILLQRNKIGSEEYINATA